MLFVDSLAFFMLNFSVSMAMPCHLISHHPFGRRQNLFLFILQRQGRRVPQLPILPVMNTGLGILALRNVRARELHTILAQQKPAEKRLLLPKAAISERASWRSKIDFTRRDPKRKRTKFVTPVHLQSKSRKQLVPVYDGGMSLRFLGFIFNDCLFNLRTKFIYF
jgi:hypothetical protein